MITLFIDTHSKMLNLGIVKNDELLIEVKKESHMEHSSKTLLNIKEMFKNVKMEINEIDQVIVITGPGSYTGLRIGVTIAKTLAYTLNKKIIASSSLKAAAISKDYNDKMAVLIDAKRDHSFAGIYDKNYNEVLIEQYISNEKLQESIDDNTDVIKDEFEYDILKIVKYYQNKETINPHLVVPNYLKDTYIEKK